MKTKINIAGIESNDVKKLHLEGGYEKCYATVTVTDKNGKESGTMTIHFSFSDLQSVVVENET